MGGSASARLNGFRILIALTLDGNSTIDCSISSPVLPIIPSPSAESFVNEDDSTLQCDVRLVGRQTVPGGWRPWAVTREARPRVFQSAYGRIGCWPHVAAPATDHDYPIRKIDREKEASLYLARGIE